MVYRIFVEKKKELGEAVPPFFISEEIENQNGEDSCVVIVCHCEDSK